MSRKVERLSAQIRRGSRIPETLAERDSRPWFEMEGVSINGAPPRVTTGDPVYEPTVQLLCQCRQIIGYVSVYDTRERLPKYGTVLVATTQYLEDGTTRPVQVREVPVALTGRTDLPHRTTLVAFCPGHGWRSCPVADAITASRQALRRASGGKFKPVMLTLTASGTPS